MATVKQLIKLKHFSPKCAFCGYNKYPICLTVHHIFPKYFFNPQPTFLRKDRYFILCPTCHALLHRGIFVNDGLMLIRNKIDYCKKFYCNTTNIDNIIKLANMVYSIAYIKKNAIHL